MRRVEHSMFFFIGQHKVCEVHQKSCVNILSKGCVSSVHTPGEVVRLIFYPHWLQEPDPSQVRCVDICYRALGELLPPINKCRMSIIPFTHRWQKITSSTKNEAAWTRITNIPIQLKSFLLLIVVKLHRTPRCICCDEINLFFVTL